MPQTSTYVLAIAAGIVLTLAFVVVMYRLQKRNPEAVRSAEGAMGCLELLFRLFGGR